MSANGDSAHGFELPSASASTLMTAAAIANFSQNHGQQQHLSVHHSHSRSKSKSRNNDKIASVPISAPVTAAAAAAAAAPPTTAATTSTATAAAAALLPARRPRHQITRSITEFSPPLRMHRHRHSHHHHPTQHALHLNAQSRKDRDRLLLLDERAPGAAGAGGLGGRSSFDMTRSEYVTPSRSPDSSRRTSALVGPMIGGGENPAAVTPPSRKLRKVNNEAALVEEKGRTANRVAGLKNSLVELSGFSTATTRRLDETYYSVLEKKSMLQNTISAIRELTEASRQMTGEFVSEADEMARDVAGQLDTFGQFGEQESRIKTLQGRIESGRTRIEGLSGRVDLVRRRIEGWERADREWQEKTRKRLRAVWIVTSVVFAVLILLFVGAQYLGGPADPEGAAGRALKGLERGANRSVDGAERAPKLSPLWEDRRGREEEEDRLRVFDEL
ncbi:hypothetical protein CTAM01_00275 [Colletotrichum tamarilloi]|uniref:Uncharacterized protein n=1 Tax=Colletotrichum tamarilloi TaxID=1209934 RepID=A0ABQ9RUS9_9PEZI|nr:uncharacterized protein CTAM01_00275 [Colletotrichum tamarilloi]KAI3534720.1 hypothetical protein CSPX01_11864 [Colletotrichum filicis]KAK1512880.1 hypothetical protein CTAM01_00275 [Colletotrichum tamarilloi]